MTGLVLAPPEYPFRRAGTRSFAAWRQPPAVGRLQAETL